MTPDEKAKSEKLEADWQLAQKFLRLVVDEANLQVAARSLLTEFDYRDLQRVRDTIGNMMGVEVWDRVIARIKLFRANRTLG